VYGGLLISSPDRIVIPAAFAQFVHGTFQEPATRLAGRSAGYTYEGKFSSLDILRDEKGIFLPDETSRKIHCGEAGVVTCASAFTVTTTTDTRRGRRAEFFPRQSHRPNQRCGAGGGTGVGSGGGGAVIWLFPCGFNIGSATAPSFFTKSVFTSTF